MGVLQGIRAVREWWGVLISLQQADYVFSESVGSGWAIEAKILTLLEGWIEAEFKGNGKFKVGTDVAGFI